MGGTRWARVGVGARCVIDVKVHALGETSMCLRGWGLSNLVWGSGWFGSAVATYMGRRGDKKIGRKVSTNKAQCGGYHYNFVLKYSGHI